jgi:hypothetical protein
LAQKEPRWRRLVRRCPVLRAAMAERKESKVNAKNEGAETNRPARALEAADDGKRGTATGGDGQAEVYGRNPPAADEDQNIRGSGMTDIADVAQNQMPGTPQDLAIDPEDPMAEVRRRDFDRTVKEYERKHRSE